MTYNHFTIAMRHKLEFALALEVPVSEIAKELGFDASTIRRELARNDKPYDAYKAQARYHAAKQRCAPRTMLDDFLKEDIETHIKELKWSPEQYAGRYKTVSFKAIYNWIKAGLLNVTMEMLRRKGKASKSEERRGQIKGGKHLSERSKEGDNRSELGHFELDTVLSPRGKDKSCVATFVERRSRIYLVCKIPDRTGSSMLSACRWLKDKLPPGIFQSAACDNGKEFSPHEDIEAILGCPVYFADPYSSWQRGSSENSNGLLREFFPKGTKFGDVSQEKIDQAVHKINSRPRKVLGFRTNYEVFEEEIVHLT